MKSLGRALRVPDWGIQLLVVWVVAFIYWRVTDLPLGPYLTQVAVVSLWLVPFLIGGYMLNNYCDRFADSLKGGASPAPGLAPGLTLILAVTGLLISLCSLPLLFSDPQVRLVGLVAVVGGLAYSLPWPRLKERPWWGMLTAATMQRLPGILMIAWVFPLSRIPLVALVLWMLVLGLVFILEHQLADRQDDLRTGVRTWATCRSRLAIQLFRHRLYLVYRMVGLATGLILILAAPGRSGIVAALVFGGGSYLLEFLAWRRYLGNRNLPRRDEMSPPKGDRRVLIQGGGLAGLTAAIKLAQWGWQPVVQESHPAGSWPVDQPVSIHAVRFDPAFVEAYLDLPVASCFERVHRETMYLEGRLRATSSPHWVCRRGKGPGTLDTYLTEWARKLGVVFGPPGAQDRPAVASQPPTILATGLMPETYVDLDLEHTPLSGFWASGPSRSPRVLLTYLGRFTHPNYGYVASCGKTVYALIFSRKGVSPGSLAKFQRQLAATEGISFTRWHPMRGAVPRKCRLFHRDRILAGTLSGMMDPFWYSGVSGGLLSGGLAALAVVDPDLARWEHRRFTGNFRGQLVLADLADRMPWRAALGLWAINGMIDPAGSIGRWCRSPRRHRGENLAQLPALELVENQVRSGG